MTPALPNRARILLRWRNTRFGGALLSADLWWVGAVNPSEMQPGRWHWKIADTGVDHYCDTREQAISECQAAALAETDNGRGYVMAAQA